MNRWTKWVGRLAMAIMAVAATAGAGAVTVAPLSVTFAAGSATTIIGLNNVNVGDTFYNISFGDTWGSSPSFLTVADAKTANDALLALFKPKGTADNPLTTLDGFPKNTAGCGYIQYCTMVTTYGSSYGTGSTVDAVLLQNQFNSNTDGFVGLNGRLLTGTTTGFALSKTAIDANFYTVATWTPVVSAVPEPESYAMLLAGLGLMGTIARRRKAKLA